MKTLLSVEHDEAAVADAAARLQLRRPNAQALDKVAEATAASPGVSLEVVCAMATGVGKTYLAAGVIDYFVAAGVRNFLIVTPGSTIQRKTVDNFTPGHRKSVIEGLNCVPTIVTPDNFNTGAVASALDDDEQVKVFVFNIDSLTPPTKGRRKRTHSFTEWVGGDLYKHLSELQDLVVLSDEHHTYSDDAEVFAKTVRSLEPVVLVGLTATPTPTDRQKIIFEYPLARAIAEGFVKTPVLVGRTDSSTDRELQIRDGLAMLAAKQEAADAWADSQGRERVNAVMFVVAESIADANDIGLLLRKPGLFENDYSERVLVIHSDASEEALLRLADVERPDSKVRVIVSVSMLKEGWDVKNIFVICSFRPSISETLTEQTLGRGLRLPWGGYTGREFLDSVEVLSHERYADILRRADQLLDGLVAERIAASTPSDENARTTSSSPSEGSDAPSAGDTPSPQPTSPHTISTTAPGTGPDVGVGPELIGTSGSGGLDASHHDRGVFADKVDDEPAPAVVTIEERKEMGKSAAADKPRTLTLRHDFEVPRVRREVAGRPALTLSSIPEADFRDLGRQIGAHDTAKLSRMELSVVEDGESPSGLKLVPKEVEGVSLAASIVELPLEDVQRSLKQGLLSVRFVRSSAPADGNAANRLANALIEGAGGERKVAPYVSQTIKLMTQFLAKKHRQSPDQYENHVDESYSLPAERPVLRKRESNRYGQFDRKASYSGWSKKAAYEEAWFDSEPERAFANLIDSSDSAMVTKWARLHIDDLVVEWEGGRYNPDFVFTTDTGVHYLVEVKGQDRLKDAEVLAKRRAATEWARFVSDDGRSGEWRYLFVPQSEVRTPLSTLINRLTAE
ncbi:DEAD/DEAH box helicase family protein [Nocardioidaceae bacterium]|nr:DEAD/DEAH box helicase family protein [Nocardioidaceae bacterium]